MITGIVQEVINNGVGKGSGIRVDGSKYGCFDPVKSGVDVIAVGDEVQFEWTQKGQYKNIQGRVNKTGLTGTPVPVEPSSSGGKKSWGGNKGVFPVPALDGQRSIIRQNSVTNAVNLFKHTTDTNAIDNQEAAEAVIEIARIFEEYSSGDDVEKLANEAIAQMNATDE